MSTPATKLLPRALELRREFDRSFALAPSAGETARIELLAISVAANQFALRLSDVAGIYADKRITRVPGAAPSMLGIAGFRGSIAPIYDLARLMGQPQSHAPRWLVVARAAPIAIAFDGFDGQLRLTADAIKPQQSRDAHDYTKEFAQTEGGLRPIIDLQMVIETIKA
ncbi:MAG: chemotaxis protein CheW [Alphaproteobacteria bacterium]